MRLFCPRATPCAAHHLLHLVASLPELHFPWLVAGPWQLAQLSLPISPASPGSLLKLASFIGSQMPSVLLSPLGALSGWRKAERLLTFLKGAAFNSATAAVPLRSEMDPKADGSAVTILSPRIPRIDPK